MKSKIIGIILLVVALVFIILGTIIYNNEDNNTNSKNNDDNQVMSEELAKDYVVELTDIIMNGGSKNELVKKLGTNQILENYIMTGKDMFLRNKPSKKIIDNYNLEKYVSTNQSLTDKLEETIKNNFEYEIKEVNASKEYTSVVITYRSFYYKTYIMDLSTIQNTLLTKAGYDLENVIEDDKFTADTYKARVKATMILDNYLDNYINKDDYRDTFVSYIDNKIEKSSEEFVSYFLILAGSAYGKQGLFTTEEEINNLLNNYDINNALDI